MRKKLLSFFALLLLAVTGAWADASMLETPLTLEAKTAGTIVVQSPKSGMQYTLNGGAKTAMTGDEYSITVAVGDKVQFYGNGTSITSYDGTTISGGTADCYIYGNIMSLVDENSYFSATALTDIYAFAWLFNANTHLYSHDTKKLVLPATTLAESCYEQMFYGCTSLTTAPELPATTLVSRCYRLMFCGCTNLNAVTCLATDLSASGATIAWLNGVAATGTFTKSAEATDWSTSVSGIPEGWTRENIATLTDGSSIGDQLKCAGESCDITYKRSFTEGKASTVCLPFAYVKKTGDGSFYMFTSIEKVGDEYIATMTEPSETTLTANTPYLYMPLTTGEVDFGGTYTIPASITAGTTTSGDWKFVGTYDTQSWTEAPTGIYGFSAQDVAADGITQGQFVKVGAYVRIKPMRAYLMYDDGNSNYSAVRALEGKPAATAGETLPASIKVRFVDANGEVTGIGTIETQTGEVSFDPEAWYTLEGIRLAEKPTMKGIYVNNGKKVMIK